MNPFFQKSLHAPIAGNIVIGYSQLRDVSILELRNSSSSPDSSHMFYRMRMLGFTEDNDFNLHRYYRIQSIAKKYITYSAAYSLDSIETIQRKLPRSFFSNYLIIPSEDIVGLLRILDHRLIQKKSEPDICRKDRLFKEIRFEHYMEFIPTAT